MLLFFIIYYLSIFCLSFSFSNKISAVLLVGLWLYLFFKNNLVSIYVCMYVFTLLYSLTQPVFIPVINTMTPSNMGRKGFILCTSYIHPEGESWQVAKLDSAGWNCIEFLEQICFPGCSALFNTVQIIAHRWYHPEWAGPHMPIIY